jgi:RNA polymerase sigma-70 factor (ECF subfamily)
VARRLLCLADMLAAIRTNTTPEDRRVPVCAVDEAMSRYACGDADAFTMVYGVVAPRVASYLRRRMRDESRVADLVQQTFLHMHRARRTFIAGSQVLPWAFAIARRQLVDAYRSAERDLSSAIATEHLEGPSPCGGGEELLSAKEAARRALRALAGLSPPQRAAYELVKGDGLSLVEAAAALGTTVTGVKLRTHRAYAALRLALND